MNDKYKVPRPVEEIRKQYEAIAAQLGEKAYMAKAYELQTQNLIAAMNELHMEMNAAMSLHQKENQNVESSSN